MPAGEASRPRVALFRAREDAAASAARLRRLGFSTVCLPVIEAVPLAAAPARDRYDAAIATSAKAFLRDAPVDRATPLFVVGEKTARAAGRRGWRFVAPPARDAASLVEGLVRSAPAGGAVLYLAGRDRKPAIETALTGTHALEVAEVYAAEARERWSAREIHRLRDCVAALHYSRRSAALAAGLVGTAGLTQLFRGMVHVCISADAAAPLKAAGAPDVRVAARPDEAGLLAALAVARDGFHRSGAPVYRAR